MFQPVAQGQDEGGGVGRVDIDVDMISFTKMDSTQAKVMYNVGIDLKTWLIMAHDIDDALNVPSAADH